MGKLNKKVLTSFIDSECKKQLFLSIAEGFSEWFNPHYDIIPGRPRIGVVDAYKKGKEYERIIYKFLQRIPSTKLKLDQNNNVSYYKLTPQGFIEVYDEVTSNYSSIFLLEGEYAIPDSFFLDLLGENPNVPATENLLLNSNLTNQSEVRRIRPDIHIFTNYEDCFESKYEILSDQTVNRIEPPFERVGIRIFDIKMVHPDNINKRQFIELFFYSTVLAHYLEINNLSDKFFVEVEHGIFPNIDDPFITETDDFINYTVPLSWKETTRLFQFCKESIQSLFSKVPLNVADIDLKIQPSCGRCNFLEDCKKQLGYNEATGSTPDLDVRLLPYLSSATSERLIDLGYQTIQNVSDNIDSLHIGNIPDPIYIELAMLPLKANSLLDNEVHIPVDGHVESVALPKFSDISLTFSIELDPLSQRVFAIGLHYSVFVKESRLFGPLFTTWWYYWNEFLIEFQTIDENSNEWYSMIDQYYEQLSLDFPKLTMNDFKTYLLILLDFKKNNATLRMEGDVINIIERNPEEEEIEVEQEVIQADYTAFNYGYAYINDNLMDTSELAMCKSIITQLGKIILFSAIMEKYIFVTDRYNKERRPVLNIFYWSREIFEHLRLLFQRNLALLMQDSELRSQIDYLMNLFAPPDENLNDPHYHKKLFDLRVFVESIMAFPFIINYTWHDIYKYIYNTIKINEYYWTPHFNYMDYRVWYRFLNEDDSNKKTIYQNGLLNQIKFKVRTINALRIYFQSKNRGLISKESYAVQTKEIGRRDLPPNFHLISHIWHIFSRLTFTQSEQEAIFLRTIFPEFSIGKLRVAKIRNLAVFDHPERKLFKYIFEIVGLSVNAKISEGNRVLLVPGSLRHQGGLIKWWTIDIESMEWNNYFDGWMVESKYINKNYIAKHGENEAEWYLFPYSSDNWTKKLSYFLNQYNLGGSWLGHRLTKLWDIGDIILDSPIHVDGRIVSIQELYLFMPHIVDGYGILNTDPVPIPHSVSLMTTIFPSPDESQKEAIYRSSVSSISAIQGPPGTGKSQTIVAFLDELHHQFGRPLRILITAFSYQAMRVLMEKIRDSQNNDNLVPELRTPTAISQYTRILFRSENRDPFSLDLVWDLFRRGQVIKLRTSEEQEEHINVPIKDGCHLEDTIGESFIMFANAHQLHRLHMPKRRQSRGQDVYTSILRKNEFDVIIVDEASQLPLDYYLAPLLFVKDGKYGFLDDVQLPNMDSIANLRGQWIERPEEPTKVVIVGDHHQLPPVQPVQPPEKLSPILGSLFQYYAEKKNNFAHNIPKSQLKINYRSNADIVRYTSSLGFYDNLEAFNPTQKIVEKISILSEPWATIMDPDKAVSVLIHDNRFETSVSELEAKIASELVISYYRMEYPSDIEEELEFWRNKVGIVAPHTAQGRLITRMVKSKLTSGTEPISHLEPNLLIKELMGTIFSVEKFQGSDRNFMIASIGISSTDQLRGEEEFIYDLSRFNVLTSRAKQKFVLICSHNFLYYFPRDRKVLNHSSTIRHYAYEFCNTPENGVELNFPEFNEILIFRWHSLD